MSAATISLFMRQLLLQQFFFPTPTPPVPNIYVALTNAVPVANSTGAVLDEPVVGDYARVQVPVDAGNWVVDQFANAYNLLELTFPLCGDDWGFIQGYALCTTDEGGETLCVGRLTQPVYVETGMQLALAQGAIYLELTD